jgi:hypothetical protein
MVVNSSKHAADSRAPQRSRDIRRTQISEDDTARDNLLLHSRCQMSSLVIIYRAREEGWALGKHGGLLGHLSLSMCPSCSFTHVGLDRS